MKSVLKAAGGGHALRAVGASRHELKRWNCFRRIHSRDPGDSCSPGGCPMTGLARDKVR